LGKKHFTRSAAQQKRQQTRWEAAKLSVAIADTAAFRAFYYQMEDDIFDIRWLQGSIVTLGAVVLNIT